MGSLIAMPGLLPRISRALGATSIALLAACGGGGDDGAPAAPPSDESTQGAAAPGTAAGSVGTAGTAGTADGAAADCGIAAFSSTALARINQHRAAGASCGARGSFAPAVAVRWNDQLTQAATAHSLDMATQNYFSHTSADGRSMSDRINATGFSWSSLGENIAAGQVGIDAVIDGWMRSDGHCANMMNPAFDTIGLACVAGGSGSAYRSYWTLNLARAR